jgi:hypothetical protein
MGLEKNIYFFVDKSYILLYTFRQHNEMMSVKMGEKVC